MKHILLALSVVCFLSTTAHAVTRWSYNPTFGNPIKVLNTWYPSGWTTRSVSYSYDANGCLVVAVNTYVFGILVGSEVTTVCPT